MEVGMLSASYLPSRFRALTVSSFFSIVLHFSTQNSSRLYLRVNGVNLSNYFFYFFIARGRKATYVICHHLANSFRETSDQETRLVSTSKSHLFSVLWSQQHIHTVSNALQMPCKWNNFSFISSMEQHETRREPYWQQLVEWISTCGDPSAWISHAIHNHATGQEAMWTSWYWCVPFPSTH